VAVVFGDKKCFAGVHDQNLGEHWGKLIFEDFTKREIGA
jgi:hypothetical protein